MNPQRFILEMGMGNDLHGQDYTKAAIRAVESAMRRSSIAMFSTLDLDHREMTVKVTIGVQNPQAVDVQAVADYLPRGKAEVSVVFGGQDVDSEDGTKHVIATAAIEAHIKSQAGLFSLSSNATKSG